MMCDITSASMHVADALTRRLLDDNRELFIADTQQTVTPHPSFVLFATQNPAGGAYGGRKMLSRAFRNRFLEVRLHAQVAEVFWFFVGGVCVRECVRACVSMCACLCLPKQIRGDTSARFSR